MGRDQRLGFWKVTLGMWGMGSSWWGSREPAGRQLLEQRQKLPASAITQDTEAAETEHGAAWSLWSWVSWGRFWCFRCDSEELGGTSPAIVAQKRLARDP